MERWRFSCLISYLGSDTPQLAALGFYPDTPWLATGRFIGDGLPAERSEEGMRVARRLES